MLAQLQQGRFYGRIAHRRRVGDVTLVDSVHAPGTRLPRHTHERAYFCVNHGGSYVEDYGRRRRVCRPGMLVFHPAGESHSETHDGCVASLNVELGGAWLQRFADIARPLDQPVELRGDAADAGLRILHELRGAGADRALCIEALIWEILGAVSERAHAVADGRPRWLLDVRDVLEAHPCTPLSLRDIAEAVGVHPVHLAATFRRVYGCSVGEYARRRRLRFAIDQLASTDLSLAEIAFASGFADQSHFTRAFKRFVGVTPARYRATTSRAGRSVQKR